MGRKRKDQETKQEVITIVKPKKFISLIEFLEKRKITGFLRRAFLKKFSINDKFTEEEWLKK